MSKMVSSTQHLLQLVLGGHRAEAAGQREESSQGNSLQGMGWAALLCVCAGGVQ